MATTFAGSAARSSTPARTVSFLHVEAARGVGGLEFDPRGAHRRAHD